MKKTVFILMVIMEIFVVSCNNKKQDDVALEQKANWLKAMYSDNVDSLNKSVQILEYLYKKNSDNLSVNMNLVDVYSIKKDKQKAIFHIKKTLELDKNNAESYAFLGVYCEMDNKLDSAKLYYKLAFDKFVSRQQSTEYKKITGFSGAALMIMLLDNDSAKALNFIRQKRKETENIINEKTNFIFNEAEQLIRHSDRSKIIQDFGL
jgi:tetratricopeptide (TPR) repeat protein